MKAHTLTGEQAYNWGKHSDLYRRNLGDNSFELITFESYGPDGIIIGRDERDSAVIFRENRVYTLYTRNWIHATMTPNPTSTYDVPTLLVMARNLGVKVEERFRTVYAPQQISRNAGHRWVGFKDKKKQTIVNAFKKHGWAVQVFIPMPNAKW